MYVFSPSVLDLIPEAKPMSLEKEVFPLLADQGQLFAMVRALLCVRHR